MTALNPTLISLDLKRLVRDFATLLFTIGLPGVLFLVFGATQEAADLPVGNGNVSMYVMISMAAYGASTATTSIAGVSAVERSQGWGRQLGLTPFSDSGYIALKTIVSLIIAAMPIVVVYALGWWRGAEGDGLTWMISAVVVLFGSVLFALYGLAIALAFRSETAVSASAGGLVILAFLGNVFVPLSGTLLEVARFTPMYGYVALARYPLTEGWVPTGNGPEAVHEPLWWAIANLVCWIVIFGAAAIWLVRRGRERQ